MKGDEIGFKNCFPYPTFPKKAENHDHNCDVRYGKCVLEWIKRAGWESNHASILRSGYGFGEGHVLFHVVHAFLHSSVIGTGV